MKCIFLESLFLLYLFIAVTLLTIYLSICAKGRGVQWVLGAQNWQSEVSFSTLDTHTHRALPHMSPDQSVKTRSMWSPCDPPAWKTFSLDNVTSLSGFKCASLQDNILTVFFPPFLTHWLRGLSVDWDGAMLRRTAPRVCWLWILLSSVLVWRVHCASGQSCHEVKTAFQLRQVGSLRWVPETAATGSFICNLLLLWEARGI